MPAHPHPVDRTPAPTGAPPSQAYARADIHAAVAAADDPHRRRQYALSARDYAVTVLLANDATADQTRHADYYLTDAEAFIATTADH